MNRVVVKILSKNDLGLSGSHQAGILVPKELVKEEFFPRLDEEEFNPHCMIVFFVGDKKYEFNYIHYNSKVFGTGTRNEYRLTRLSRFYKDFGCGLGDRLVFSFSEKLERYYLSVKKIEQVEREIVQEYTKDHPLVIHANWEF